jgi:hypothetical protein
MNLTELKNFITYKQNEQYSGLPVNIKGWKDYLPALSKGQSIVVSAGVGVGKTTFTLDKFVLDQISFVNRNPQIDCYYSYFSLEETKQRMDLKILGRFLYQMTGLQFGIQDFTNLDGSKKVLNHISQLDLTKPLVDTFNDKVEVIGDCKTPKQIKAKIAQTIEKLRLKLSNPNFYYLVVIDNLKFVKGDGGQLQKDAIDEICVEILQEYRVKYDMIPIVIQHQNRAGETPLYDYKKNIIIDSVLPSLANLGVSTYTQDPATHVIGIFDPHRYKINEYPITNGYDINTWGDHFRSVLAMKGRDGLAPETYYYFNGKVSLFEEIPEPDYFKSHGYTNYGIVEKTKKKPTWQTQVDLGL